MVILFSGLFPVGDKEPQQQRLWLQAERFGARCVAEKQEDVTHVVGKQSGTEKVHASSALAKCGQSSRRLHTSAAASTAWAYPPAAKHSILQTVITYVGCIPLCAHTCLLPLCGVNCM